MLTSSIIQTGCVKDYHKVAIPWFDPFTFKGINSSDLHMQDAYLLISGKTLGMGDFKIDTLDTVESLEKSVE